MSAKQDRQGARTAPDLERKYNFGKKFAELMGISLDTRDKVECYYSKLSNEIETKTTAIIRDTEKIILEALSEYTKTGDFETFKKTCESEFKVMADQITANLKTTTEQITQTNNGLTEFRQETESRFKATSEQMSANLRSTTEQITKVSGVLEDVNGQLSEQSDVIETIKKNYESSLKLTPEELDLRFQQTEEKLRDENGELQRQINEITKYFTFDINGLTIGQVDNPNKVVIDNDEIIIMVGGKERQRFDANGNALIPKLAITESLNLLGLLVEESNTHINITYTGGV